MPNTGLLPNNTQYQVAAYPGVAFWYVGDEEVATEDTTWSGIWEKTGNVNMVMVGDDFIHTVDPDTCTPLAEGESCAECGQIGCTADGR